MKGISLEIPGEVLSAVRIPRAQLESELRRRLAAALFADGVLGGFAACKLAGMGKAEFQHWLGEHGIEQPLDVSDYESDCNHLEEWLRNA
jgi:predicted HTH domain antitoxin